MKNSCNRRVLIDGVGNLIPNYLYRVIRHNAFLVEIGTTTSGLVALHCKTGLLLAYSEDTLAPTLFRVWTPLRP
jgi:hypothetical protein